VPRLLSRDIVGYFGEASSVSLPARPLPARPLMHRRVRVHSCIDVLAGGQLPGLALTTPAATFHTAAIRRHDEALPSAPPHGGPDPCCGREGRPFGCEEGGRGSRRCVHVGGARKRTSLTFLSLLGCFDSKFESTTCVSTAIRRGHTLHICNMVRLAPSIPPPTACAQATTAAASCRTRAAATRPCWCVRVCHTSVCRALPALSSLQGTSYCYASSKHGDLTHPVPHGTQAAAESVDPAFKYFIRTDDHLAGVRTVRFAAVRREEGVGMNLAAAVVFALGAAGCSSCLRPWCCRLLGCAPRTQAQASTGQPEGVGN